MQLRGRQSAPHNTRGLSLQGYAGRLMKPLRHLRPSAGISTAVLVIIAAIACLSATLAASSSLPALASCLSPPLSHMSGNDDGRGLDSDPEESDYDRHYDNEEDGDSDDSDELVYRPAAVRASTQTSNHHTRGAARYRAQQQKSPAPSTFPAPTLQPLPLPPPPPPPPPTPRQQPQQQQQQQPPPLLPTASATCIAIKKSGKYAGSVCGNRAGARKPGFCQHHDGMTKRRKVAATSPQLEGSGAGAGAGAEDEPGYGSDEDPGGGVDELQIQGAGVQQSKQQAAHYSKAEKIEDLGFRAAFKKVWHLKKQPASKPAVSLILLMGADARVFPSVTLEHHAPFFACLKSTSIMAGGGEGGGGAPFSMLYSQQQYCWAVPYVYRYAMKKSALGVRCSGVCL